MADTANSIEQSNYAILQPAQIDTRLNIISLYQEWKRWGVTLANCPDELETQCYAMLTAYEHAIMSKHAITVQDFAIQVLVYTDNGSFELSSELVETAKRLTQTH